MDRALSFFGVYDVFGYLASGLSAVVGVWWVVEGSIPHLSIVALLGLLGGSYIAGHLTAILGNIWERLWWRWKGKKPYTRLIEEDSRDFHRALRIAISSRIESEVGVRDLDARERFNLARAKLRLDGFEQRAETMRAMHGLCRNLVGAAAVICVAAIGTGVVDGGEARLTVTAVSSFLAIWAFLWRALKFEYRFGREVWLSYLALRMS